MQGIIFMSYEAIESYVQKAMEGYEYRYHHGAHSRIRYDTTLLDT